MNATDIQVRLEYLRAQLRAERISYGELVELQSLAAHIQQGDTELLEAAGIPEQGTREMSTSTEPQYCTNYVSFTDDIVEYELAEISDKHNGAPITILRQIVSTDGTCATVYEINGARYYRAMEYLEEDGEVSGQYGYETTEKHYYMGQRYRGLWGEYESEVYYTP